MQPDQRIVTKLPLTELWDSNGALTLMRQRAVGREQIANLLRVGMVRFVIANCGHPLIWLPPADRHRFWKDEAKPHLVDPDLIESGFRVETFPSAFCFIGSQWGENETEPVVVLETHH